MQLEDINMSSAPDRSSRRSRSSSRSTSSSSSGDEDEDTRTGRGGLSAPPPHAAIRTPSPELPPTEATMAIMPHYKTNHRPDSSNRPCRPDTGAGMGYEVWDM